VHDSLVFLDAVRHCFVYGSSEMRRVSEREARLGLGVMGFADLLRKAGVKYNEPMALRWADAIGSSMSRVASEYKRGQRKVLTLAPTGGTSLITGASFSIEPYFKQAHSVTPSQHVLIQSAWQKHIDNGVSKTVNLPFEATYDDVAGIYDMAFETNCKGVTVYRDGSRDSQPIQTSK
jgi:ribonucleotide reductase alpha subunit